MAALPPPLLPLVDALTRDDARLFVAGLARLLRELAAVERAVRGRLVCDAKLHALRAELAQRERGGRARRVRGDQVA